MTPDDVTIEILDPNLTRRATVLPQYWQDWKSVSALRATGSWSMSLPTELPAAQQLAQPGWGILVTGPDGELFSGPHTKPVDKADRTDPTGSYTFEGVDYNVILADALAWPQPANPDVTTQTVAYDVRTGPAETVIRSLISANIGPDAPAGRRVGFTKTLTLEPDQGRGSTVTASCRFDNLLDTCASLARIGGIGFRIVVGPAGLVLKFFTPQDKSKLIRLDIANGRLSSYEHTTAAPTITHAIVAGQGEGAARTLLERTSSDSVAAESAWNRRIEQFVDQRNTNDPTELQQAGDDALANGGYTTEQTKLTPTDDETMRYQRDWFQGDFITVVIRGDELSQVVTQAGMAISSAGVLIGAQVGDLDPDDLRNMQLTRRVSRLETRL